MSGPAGVGIGEWLPLSAARHPDKACFVHADGSELSFGAVNERVNRPVDRLTAAGVQRGDRIAVLAVDSHRYAEVVLAAMKLGAVYLPLNNRLQAAEVATLTERGRPAALFHSGRYAGLVEGLEVATVVDLDDAYEPLLAVPDGEVGEITTRSDMVMDGYLDGAEATGRSLRDGWFRVGDLAHRDREGYLSLAGRKGDMIIRGGENISPVEIESVLAAHPAVSLVSVVGVPDDHWGETVRAWLTLRPGATATPDELAAFCRDRLAGFKVPGDFRIVGELPLNAAGKILKRELRQWG